MQIPTTLTTVGVARRGREQKITSSVLILTSVLTAGLYALLWLSA